MTRLLTILTLIFILFLTSCGQNRSGNKAKSEVADLVKVNTSIIAILPFTASHLSFKDCNPLTLTNNDLIDIEKLLRQFVEDYNPERERQYNEIITNNPGVEIDKKNFIIDLTRYKRQYIAMTNDKGEKEVWINCFCSTSNKNWRKESVFVCDGGNCYFNLKINLTTGKYRELRVNGDA